MEHKFYYQHTKGDKETFHFAWRMLQAPFIMLPTPTGSAGFGKTAENYRGFTMVQHDAFGRVMFLHRNLKKWTTGFKPVKTKGLKEYERTWVSIKECVARKRSACPGLIDWKDGLMTWADSSTNARGKTLTIMEAIGWDVEERLLEAFVDLWEESLYAAYMHDILMANGPAGAYHVTCKKCHMDPKNPKVLECRCQGLDGTYEPSELDDAVMCMKIENINGILKCGDDGWEEHHEPKKKVKPDVMAAPAADVGYGIDSASGGTEDDNSADVDVDLESDKENVPVDKLHKAAVLA